MKIRMLVGMVFALCSMSIILAQTDISDASVAIIGNNAILAIYPGNTIKTTSIE